jgi:hypothetical protein
MYWLKRQHGESLKSLKSPHELAPEAPSQVIEAKSGQLAEAADSQLLEQAPMTRFQGNFRQRGMGEGLLLGLLRT